MPTVDWPPIQLSFIKLPFWKFLGPLHFQWTMKTNWISIHNNKSDDTKCAQEKSTSTLLSYIFSKTLICHVRKSIMAKSTHPFWYAFKSPQYTCRHVFFLSLRWLRKILKLLIKYNHTKCIFTDCNIINKKNNFLLIININCY